MARDDDRVAKLDGEMAEEAACEKGRGRERGLVWSPALKVWGGHRCWWAGQTAGLENGLKAAWLQPGLQWRWPWAGGTEAFLQAEPKPRLPSQAAHFS